METKLTRDAEYVVAVAYKLFLEKRKAGVPRDSAMLCEIDDLCKNCTKMSNMDVKDTVSEICRKFGCRIYINCSFIISDDLIAYMENRYQQTLQNVLDFLSQFVVPFLT